MTESKLERALRAVFMVSYWLILAGAVALVSWLGFKAGG